jgi:hypothetical protein
LSRATARKPTRPCVTCTLHPAGRTLLDVGCGEGEFLAEMQALGWAMEGIEPSARGAAAARGRGFPVIESTFVLFSPSSLRRLLSTIGFEA